MTPTLQRGFLLDDSRPNDPLMGDSWLWYYHQHEDGSISCGIELCHYNSKVLLHSGSKREDLWDYIDKLGMLHLQITNYLNLVEFQAGVKAKVQAREFLNPNNLNYTGYVAYSVEPIGSDVTEDLTAHLRIGSCIKSIDFMNTPKELKELSNLLLVLEAAIEYGNNVFIK